MTVFLPLVASIQVRQSATPLQIVPGKTLRQARRSRRGDLAGSSDAKPARGDRGLGSICHPKLAHDQAEVDLNRGLLDPHGPRNHLIRFALDQQTQHLPLPWRPMFPMLDHDLVRARRALNIGPEQSARTDQRFGRVERAAGQDYSDGMDNKARREAGRNIALDTFAESRDPLLGLLTVREDDYGEGGNRAANEMQVLR